MKNLFFLICMTLLSVCVTAAQPPKLSTMSIQTSAVCGMCETTISKALYAVKGVKKVTMDLNTKVVTVAYNTKQVQPAAIRTAISKAGYDADNVIADPAAYDKLHGCCKKDAKH